MTAKIRVLIVDDTQATRENIVRLIEFHPEIVAMDQAAGAQEAIDKAKAQQPDIILMDINMPGMDGIKATEILSTEAPDAAIIIMSVQGEQEYLRRAMVAGAKNYLVKPFTGDELLQAIKEVYRNEQRKRSVIRLESKEHEAGKVVTVFSTKGGIGKTTIASNLAVALSERAGARVGIIDADLQFGDMALFLNLLPRATVADLMRDIDNIDEHMLEGYLTPYNEQVQLLAAPLRPEQAETITGAHLAKVIKIMRGMFDYVIIDTAPAFSDVMLTALDAADKVLLVAAMDLPTVKNVKLGLEIMGTLNYTRDKVKLVLNRANSEGGMTIAEVEETLHQSFDGSVPSDGKVVVASVNRGVPFVISHPDSAVAQSIFRVLPLVTGAAEAEAVQPRGMVLKLKRIFG